MTARRHHRCRGTTLVELLVSSSIFMLFLGVAFGLFIWGYRSWRQADVKSDNEREAILFMEELTRELSHSSERSMQVIYYSTLTPMSLDIAESPTADSCALSFLTAYDNAGEFKTDPETGDPLWQAHVVYYLNPADKTIRRLRIELTGKVIEPLAPPDYTEQDRKDLGYGNPLAENDLATAVQTGVGNIKTVSVTTFKILDIKEDPMLPTNTAINPVCVQLCIKKPSISQDEKALETIEVTRLVRTNN